MTVYVCPECGNQATDHIGATELWCTKTSQHKRDVKRRMKPKKETTE